MAKAKPKTKPKRRPPKEPPPEIPVIGEIYEETESDVIKAILDVLPGEEVIVYIDSAGGSVYSAMAIAALLRMRKLKTTAVVLGECSSAALLIFAACRKRLVTPRSVFLFHRVKWRSDKDMRHEEAANWAKHFQWLEHEADRHQAELFGKGADVMQGWIEQGRFVLGPELVELGVAEMLEE